MSETPAARALMIGMFDVDGEDQAAFETWYTQEHVPSRLACPGFLSARRFRAVEGSPRHLIVYELDSPEALHSPEYVGLQQNANADTRTQGARFRNLVRNVYVEVEL
jgi:hypothetical protein